MDEVYIRKVCAGDTQAYRYFIGKFQSMSISLAISIVKDEFVAEEVVQDAFVKAFKAMSSFNFNSKFSTWFYRIVVNEAFMRLKKMKRDIVDFHQHYDEEVADEQSLLTVREEEQTSMINEALKILPPRESLVLRLFYLQEESIKEVCAATGWTEANTKVILHRARKSMHSVLNILMKNKKY